MQTYFDHISRSVLGFLFPSHPPKCNRTFSTEPVKVTDWTTAIREELVREDWEQDKEDFTWPPRPHSDDLDGCSSKIQEPEPHHPFSHRQLAALHVTEASYYRDKRPTHPQHEYILVRLAVVQPNPGDGDAKDFCTVLLERTGSDSTYQMPETEAQGTIASGETVASASPIDWKATKRGTTIEAHFVCSDTPGVLPGPHFIQRAPSQPMVPVAPDFPPLFEVSQQIGDNGEPIYEIHVHEVSPPSSCMLLDLPAANDIYQVVSGPKASTDQLLCTLKFDEKQPTFLQLIAIVKLVSHLRPYYPVWSDCPYWYCHTVLALLYGYAGSCDFDAKDTDQMVGGEIVTTKLKLGFWHIMPTKRQHLRYDINVMHEAINDIITDQECSVCASALSNFLRSLMSFC